MSDRMHWPGPLDPMLHVAAGLFLGLIAGSFVATLLLRWPQGRSALAGRSHCDSCGKALSWFELVPVLSFLVQKGRCRSCGATIAPSHLAIELAAAAIGATAFAAQSGGGALATALLGWWLLLIAVLDLEHHWLPDRLTLPLAAAGLGAAWAGLGPPFAERLLGAALGFTSLWLIAGGYRHLREREGLGGGDPKLLGALGAWLGWQMLPFVILGGGLLGLAWAGRAWWRGEDVQADARLPLGTLMAVAAWPMWLLVA